MRWFVPLILIVFLAFPKAYAEEDKIYFIESSEDLATVLLDQEVSGIAIWSDYYVNASPDEKKAMQSIAEELLEKPLHPLYLYGQPVEESVNRIFFPSIYFMGGQGGVGGCDPISYAGVVKRLDPEYSSYYGNMCGSDDKTTKEKIKSNILFSWSEYKVLFLGVEE